MRQTLGSLVLANMGIPMIAWHLPIAAVLLLPIVVLETYALQPLLGLPPRLVASWTLIANALSTFVGVPVAWGGMLLLQFISGGDFPHGFGSPLDTFRTLVLETAWVAPYPGQGTLPRLMLAATLVLLIPYFWASVQIERWVLSRRFRGLDRAQISRAVWRANALSYGGLALFTLARLMLALTASARPG